MPSIPILCQICLQEIKGDQAFLDHMATHQGGPKVAKAIRQNVPQNAPVVLDPNAPPSADFAQMAAAMDGGSAPTPTPSPTKPTVRLETPGKAAGNSLQEEVKKEIVLKYKYEGNCPQCNVPVRTIITWVDKRIFATAYCLTHEDLEQTEVAPIPVKKKDITPEQLARPETIIIGNGVHVAPVITEEEPKTVEEREKETTIKGWQQSYHQKYDPFIKEAKALDKLSEKPKRKEAKKKKHGTRSKHDGILSKAAIQEKLRPTGLQETNTAGI